MASLRPISFLEKKKKRKEKEKEKKSEGKRLADWTRQRKSGTGIGENREKPLITRNQACCNRLKSGRLPVVRRNDSVRRRYISRQRRGGWRGEGMVAAITMLRRFRWERSFVRRAGSGYRSSRTIGPVHNARFSFPPGKTRKGERERERWSRWKRNETDRRLMGMERDGGWRVKGEREREREKKGGKRSVSVPQCAGRHRQRFRVQRRD